VTVRPAASKPDIDVTGDVVMVTGGFKASGLGRTRGIEGVEQFTVEQFTEVKNVHFSVDDQRS
jgi:acyl-CoA reductase-like NAD-dependent aldehyde dehydrogenase